MVHPPTFQIINVANPAQVVSIQSLVQVHLTTTTNQGRSEYTEVSVSITKDDVINIKENKHNTGFLRDFSKT